MFEALRRLRVNTKPIYMSLTVTANKRWKTKNFSKSDNSKIEKLVKDYEKLCKEYDSIYDSYEGYSIQELLELDKLSSLKSEFSKVQQSWSKLDKIHKQKNDIENELDKIGGEGFRDIVFDLN